MVDYENNIDFFIGVYLNYIILLGLGGILVGCIVIIGVGVDVGIYYFKVRRLFMVYVLVFVVL